MSPKRKLPNLVKNLTKRIQTRQISVAVIGLGYVGLPLAVHFAERKVKVFGIDLDAKKIAALNKGGSYIQDVSAAKVQRAVRQNRLKATSDYQVLKKADAVIICVPTPLNRAKDPDLSFIIKATDEVVKHLHKGQIIILESTTYPGTTDEVILPKLEASGLKAGKDFFLCFSPERIDPGRKDLPISLIPKVVGGISKNCTKLGSLLYGVVFEKVVPVSSARTAEMAKLLENTFRIVNIGMINELATIAGALGIDIWEVIEAAKTKPFGFMPFYPGPGVGGHCIGIDPIYLSWKAKTHGFNIKFIDLARDVNAHMPHYVVEKTQELLLRNTKKSINQMRILISGITYKRDVVDTRESPALEVIEELARLGIKVSYHDPFVPKLRYESISLKSVSLTPKILKRQDLVLILTDHSKIDYKLIAKNSKLVFDTRNVFKNMKMEHIVKI